MKSNSLFWKSIKTGSIKDRCSTIIMDKLFVLFTVLIAVVYALSWMANNQLKQQTQTELKSHLETTLNTTHKLLVLWITGRIKFVEQVTLRSDVKELVGELVALKPDRNIILKSPQLSALRNIMKPILDQNADLGFFVTTPKGKNIASMRNGNIGIQNFTFKHQNYLQNLLQKKPQLILPLYSDVPLINISGEMSPKEPTMFIAVPMVDEEGKVFAIFSIRFNPILQFTRIVQLPGTSLSGDSYAFNKNGKLITGSRFEAQLRHLKLIGKNETSVINLSLKDPGGNLLEGYQPSIPIKKQPFTFMVQQAMAGKSGFNLEGYRDHRGVSVIGVWVWNHLYQFGLTFEINFDEAYKSCNYLKKIINIMMCVIVLFFVFAFILIKRSEKTSHINQQLQVEKEKGVISEKKFQTLLESAPDGMLLIDESGEILIVNHQIEQMFGYNRHELIGQLIEKLIPEHFRKQHTGKRSAFINKPHIRNIDTDLDLWGRHKNGHEFAIGIGLSPLELEENKVVMASVRNITQRKKDEKALKESEARLAEAQRIAHIGNWHWDQQNDHLFWSDEVFRILKISPIDTKPDNKLYQQLIHPEDAPFVKSTIKKAMDEKTEYDIWFRINCFDGTLRYIHEHGKIILDEDKHPIGTNAVIQDISELKKAELKLEKHKKYLEGLVRQRTSELQSEILVRKQAENEIVDSEEKLRAITRAAQVAIIMISHKGTVSFWNKAAEKIFGWKDDEISGQNLHKIITPERYREQAFSAFEKFQSTGKGNCIGKIRELHGIRKNGEEFPLELALSSVRLKGKWNAIGIITDISERKQAEKDLYQKMDELERFNEMSIGREHQMIKLKIEINDLHKNLGTKEKYKIVDDEQN